MVPAHCQGKPETRPWCQSGPPETCVDVLFIGDGYTRAHAPKFLRDVDRYASRFLAEPPFAWYRKKFNVGSLYVPSKDSGCDLSPKEEKVATVLESHFDAPNGRLLSFKDRARLKDLVVGSPAEIVFVIVNTEKYGGAGTVLDAIKVRDRPLPAPTCSAQDTRSFMIAIHELGHSFAGLADEYDDDKAEPAYPLPPGKDLDEANVTMPGCFDRSSFKTLAATLKWRHFLSLPGAERADWLHEGGYYRKKGVFRPWKVCMMRRHGDRFCPICMEEVAKAVVTTCGESWDDAAYHKQHPLSEWKQ
jgi:hypothetical protein